MSGINRKFNFAFVKVIFICMLFTGCGSGGEHIRQTDIQNSTEERTAADVDIINEESKDMETMDAGNHILIAYYSWSGTTEKMANSIRELTGGDIVKIEPSNPYPDSYNDVVERGMSDLRNMDTVSVEKNVEDMNQYDTILVGYPIWFNDSPAIVQVFLRNYNLEGKRIMPFCTHMSSGIGGSMVGIKNACPDSEVLDGLDKNDGESIRKWLSDAGILQEQGE